MKTPISIITGYLGSGKTTLLRRIIDETDKKLAIIMNEFGQVGIDGAVIKGKDVDMVELAGGCVCCSLTGEFEYAVKEILEKIKPEMIVVETTGVAEPDAIALDISENIPGVSMDVVITIVDADSTIRFPSIGHTGRMQIEMADVILLNKVDLVNSDQKKEAIEKIRQINERAEIFETARCGIDTNILFGIELKEKEFGPEHRDHIEKEGIEFFTFTAEKSFGRDKFEAFLYSVPKNVYRAKGFIVFDGQTYLFNFVFGRWEFEESEEKETKLVFIGKDIIKQKEDIIRKLKECEIC